MRVSRTFRPGVATASAVTIGNFDGVHLGHQAMLDRLGAAARELALPSCVLTFEPHPREFFAPDQAPARLTSLREKLQLLAQHGVDRTKSVALISILPRPLPKTSLSACFAAALVPAGCWLATIFALARVVQAISRCLSKPQAVADLKYSRWRAYCSMACAYQAPQSALR